MSNFDGEWIWRIWRWLRYVFHTIFQKHEIGSRHKWFNVIQLSEYPGSTLSPVHQMSLTNVLMSWFVAFFFSTWPCFASFCWDFLSKCQWCFLHDYYEQINWCTCRNQSSTQVHTRHQIHTSRACWNGENTMQVFFEWGELEHII